PNPVGARPPGAVAVNFSLVGPGRVGLAWARALIDAGHTLSAVAGAGREGVRQAVEVLGTGRPCETLAEVMAEVVAAEGESLLLIATPDDVILGVARELAAAAPRRWTGPAPLVAHFSGARSLDVLEPLGRKGARVASLHPLQTFAQR